MKEKDVVLVVLAEELDDMGVALDRILATVNDSEGVLVNEYNHPVDVTVAIQTLKYLADSNRKAYAEPKELPYVYTVAIGYNSGGLQMAVTYKHEISSFVEFFKNSFEDVHMWDVNAVVPDAYEGEVGLFTVYRSLDTDVLENVVVSEMLHNVLTTNYTEPDVLYLSTKLDTLADYPLGHSGLDLLDGLRVVATVQKVLHELKQPSNLPEDVKVSGIYADQLAKLDKHLEETAEYKDSDQESIEAIKLAFWREVSNVYTLLNFVGLLLADVEEADSDSDYALLSRVSFRLSDAPYSMDAQSTMDYEEFAVLLLSYMNFAPVGVENGFDEGDAENIVGFVVQQDSSVAILTENLVNIAYYRAYNEHADLVTIVPSQENYLKSISNLGQTLTLLVEE